MKWWWYLPLNVTWICLLKKVLPFVCGLSLVVCTTFFNVSKFYTLQYIYVFRMIVRTNSDYCISLNSINWWVFIMQTVFTVRYEVNFYVFVTWNSYYPRLNSLSDISLSRCVLDEQSAGGSNKKCACLVVASYLQFFKISSGFYWHVVVVTLLLLQTVQGGKQRRTIGHTLWM
jgi:hypothetical protein